MKAKILALALFLACGAQAYFFDAAFGIAPLSNVKIEGASLNDEDNDSEKGRPALNLQMHYGDKLNDMLVLAFELNAWSHDYDVAYDDMEIFMCAFGPALMFSPMPKVMLQASVGYSMLLNSIDHGNYLEYDSNDYNDINAKIYSGIAFGLGGFYDFVATGYGAGFGLLFTYSANKLSDGWERTYGLALAVRFVYKSEE